MSKLKILWCPLDGSVMVILLINSRKENLLHEQQRSLTSEPLGSFSQLNSLQCVPVCAVWLDCGRLSHLIRGNDSWGQGGNAWLLHRGHTARQLRGRKRAVKTRCQLIKMQGLENRKTGVVICMAAATRETLTQCFGGFCSVTGYIMKLYLGLVLKVGFVSCWISSKKPS